jgi:hypothetical protein
MAAVYRSPEPLSKASTSPSKASGWSSDIKDYEFFERMGKRETPTSVGGLFYGVFGAIFRCRLTNDAKQRAIDGGVPPYRCKRDFAIKLALNDPGVTKHDLLGCQVCTLHSFCRCVILLNINRWS